MDDDDVDVLLRLAEGDYLGVGSFLPLRDLGVDQVIELAQEVFLLQCSQPVG